MQKRKNGNYTPEPREIKHVQEVLQLLSVMTGNHRFEEVLEDGMERGGPKNMCEILDKIESRGENLILTLMQKLFAAGRFADAEKATNDPAFLSKLLVEFGLQR